MGIDESVWRLRAMRMILPAFLALAGCVTVEHAYPGNPREPAETARVDVDGGKFIAVDGRTVFADELRVLPGRHSVVAEFRIEGHDFGKHVVDEYVGKLQCPLDFRASAGFEYRVALETMVGGERAGSRNRFYHIAAIWRVPNTLPDVQAPCRWKR